MSYSIGLNELIITQQYLRFPQQLADMISFLADGNQFEEKIILNRCEDGRHYILDGHHRSCAIYINSTRQLFSSDNFIIKNYTYKEFEEIVFIDSSDKWLGWVTPLDIRTHVRLKDLFGFKSHIENIYYNQSPMHAVHYIKTNPDLYMEKRNAFRVRDLANKYSNGLVANVEENLKS